MRPLVVLVTAISLADRSGSTMYTRDLARQLRAMGHRPLVWSPRIGGVGEELRAEGIEVVGRLADLPARPDVVHGNHTLETVEAQVRLPGVPAVFVCHGLGWMAEPPPLPGVTHFVAVGTVTLERLVSTPGVDPARCSLVPNGVDTDRFRPSGRPLPARPRRALVFSNNATEDGYVRLVREACAARGVTVEVAGRAVGRPLEVPEAVLPDHDLVFARGRCAREAISCGCAVVLLDVEGMGGLVTSDVVDAGDRAAFGVGVLTRPHDVASIVEAIDRYDPVDAAAVTARVRAEGSLRRMAERLCERYEAAVASAPTDAATAADHGDAALAWLLDHLSTLSELGLERDEVLLDRHLRHQHTLAVEARLAEVEAERDAVASRLAALEATRWVRLRAGILAAPVVGPAAGAAARALRRRPRPSANL